MKASVDVFPLDLFLPCSVVLVIWIVASVYRTPWKQLLRTALWHRWAGGVLVIALCWRLHGNMGPGLDLHLLGATLSVLTYGLPLGSLAVVLGATIAHFSDHTALTALPVSLVMTALIPGLVTIVVGRLSKRHLPTNYFVFLFVDTCLAAAAGVIAAGFAMTAVLALGSAQSPDWLIHDYLPYYILLAFSEAWLSGAAIAVMVVWLPGWVAAFDDDRYLNKS